MHSFLAPRPPEFLRRNSKSPKVDVTSFQMRSPVVEKGGRHSPFLSCWCAAFLPAVVQFGWNLLYVADPGCLSRIPDPDFYLSRISDPTTAPKWRGKNVFVLLFFLARNIMKLVIILFWTSKEIFFSQNTKNYSTFTQNLSLIYPKYGFGIRDPGSKRDRILDPGTGSAILVICYYFFKSNK